MRLELLAALDADPGLALPESLWDQSDVPHCGTAARQSRPHLIQPRARHGTCARQVRRCEREHAAAAAAAHGRACKRAKKDASTSDALTGSLVGCVRKSPPRRGRTSVAAAQRDMDRTPTPGTTGCRHGAGPSGARPPTMPETIDGTPDRTKGDTTTAIARGATPSATQAPGAVIRHA